MSYLLSFISTKNYADIDFILRHIEEVKALI